MVETDLKKGIKAMGLMSGTSLDGLDLCYAVFHYRNTWEYEILKARTVPYPDALRSRLAVAQESTALEFARLHSDFGLYMGDQVKRFMDAFDLHPDLIASHGHTIFHQPESRFTCQIGSGAGIAAVCGVPVVCDFRTTDVALHGQGAPLVPIGDRQLFGSYDYCLNLGGFSNISYEQDGRRIAFDISPVNYVLNHYANCMGMEYDDGGQTAASGSVHSGLLDALNGLEFYTKEGPKSLGREWVENRVFPLIDSCAVSVADRLATFCEHIAMQIAGRLKPRTKVLLSGGGAYNRYLLSRMRFHAPETIFCLPDKLTIDYKEALIFAFLGVLYLCDRNSCLASVTGAQSDNIGGCLYKVYEK